MWGQSPPSERHSENGRYLCNTRWRLRGRGRRGTPRLCPRVGRLTVSISAVGCAGDELQPCYYRKLHHQTSLSFRRERLYDVEGGLFAESWSAWHWITVGESRVRLLSMGASPARLSARSLQITSTWPGLKIFEYFQQKTEDIWLHLKYLFVCKWLISFEIVYKWYHHIVIDAIWEKPAHILF